MSELSYMTVKFLTNNTNMRCSLPYSPNKEKETETSLLLNKNAGKILPLRPKFTTHY